MSETTDTAEKEPVGFMMQVKSNAFSPSAFWTNDDEFGPIRLTLAAACDDVAEALDYGYIGEHLRVVALTVVVPPEEADRG